MGSLGMLSLRVPEEHGGIGLGMLASAVFSEALGSSTFAGFDVTVLVHTDMSGPHLINSGSDEQLAEWLPGMLSGEKILSIAVTEPDAGSDVAGIRSTAVKDGDGWRINGTKMYITNAVYGDLTIVAARTDAGQQLRHLDVPGSGRHRRLQRRQQAEQTRVALFRHRRTRPRRRVGLGRADCSARRIVGSTRPWRTSRTNGSSWSAWVSVPHRRRSIRRSLIARLVRRSVAICSTSARFGSGWR